MKGFASGCLVLLLGVVACSDPLNATEVLVVVDSNLSVGTQLASLHVSVVDRASNAVLETRDIALTAGEQKDAQYNLPVSFSLATARGARDFRLLVSGMGPLGPGGAPVEVVRAQVLASFRSRERLLLPIYLSTLCLFEFCGAADTQTCDRGQCVALPESPLDPAGDGPFGGLVITDASREPITADAGPDAQPLPVPPAPECSDDSACERKLATAQPAGCVTARCMAGTCKYEAADADQDLHATSVCSWPQLALGDDCDDGNALRFASAWDGPAGEAQASRCDQVDNDCDGRADDELLAGKSCLCDPATDVDVACSLRADGANIAWPSATPIGSCRYGKRSCMAGVWGACVGAVEPQPADRCDVADDDANCNGLRGEGCACSAGATRACGVDKGACKPGSQTCVAGSWSTECVGATAPQASDSCDAGNDANCNGTPNEGCTCINGVDCVPGACVTGICQCPSSHRVEGNRCIDLCAGKSCGEGGRCEAGLCLCSSGQSVLAGTCQCPAGQSLVAGVCACPGGQVLINGSCGCVGGQTLVEGSCACVGGQALQNGVCACSGGQTLTNGACACSGGQTLIGGSCACPGGQTLVNAGCACPSGQSLMNGVCGCGGGQTSSGGSCGCTGGQMLVNGACACVGGQTLLNGSCGCAGGQVVINGACGCPGGQMLANGKCACTGGQALVNGTCACPGGQSLVNGTCACPSGQSVVNGTCACPNGQSLLNGVCACPSGQSVVNGVCACSGGQSLTNGVCSCSGGQQLVDGICACTNGKTLQNGFCDCFGGTVLTAGICKCLGGQILQGMFCVCPEGQQLVGSACAAIDPCSPNPCAANNACTNVGGVAKCSCAAGYVLTDAGDCKLPCTSGRSQDRFSCGTCIGCMGYPLLQQSAHGGIYPDCPYEFNYVFVCSNQTTNECHNSMCDP